jgi:hypothetical protein
MELKMYMLVHGTLKLYITFMQYYARSAPHYDVYLAAQSGPFSQIYSEIAEFRDV